MSALSVLCIVQGELHCWQLLTKFVVALGYPQDSSCSLSFTIKVALVWHLNFLFGPFLKPVGRWHYKQTLVWKIQAILSEKYTDSCVEHAIMCWICDNVIAIMILKSTLKAWRSQFDCWISFHASSVSSQALCYYIQTPSAHSQWLSVKFDLWYLHIAFIDCRIWSMLHASSVSFQALCYYMPTKHHQPIHCDLV